MCVHVFLAVQLPLMALVWVDRQPQHTLVYVDPTLAQDGELSPQGRVQVNAALAEAGAAMLDVAPACARPALRAVAG